MELLILIANCKEASARRITAVIPCFPYAHQDVKAMSKCAVSAKLIANMLSAAGCDHVITMDLHASQIQGFFDFPVDNLYAEPTIISWIRENVSDIDNVVFVSPDAGGTKRVASIACEIGCDMALIHCNKRRTATETDLKTEELVLVGNVQGKSAIIIDDLAESCRTVMAAVIKLKEEGVKDIKVVVTHAVFSPGTITKLIGKQDIQIFVLSNTVPQNEIIRESNMFKVFDVSGVFAEAIRRTHYGESVSFLFKQPIL
ncbi:hypothetical protein ACOME3_005412 [Neoechinorhynchus agilis]